MLLPHLEQWGNEVGWMTQDDLLLGSLVIINPYPTDEMKQLVHVCFQLVQLCGFIYLNGIIGCMENSVDPDQMASSEAI